MNERGTESATAATATWSAPECPLRIEYSKRVLDDIRLAVVDAFFSLPRGGAEIGGILLGKHEAGEIVISDYQALDCEHAMGPSFTLSPRDQARLAEMIAKAKRNPRDSQPVGWYHSHTRSEIFLSEADQDIHKRYFPEPWQVALVLKPHTFEPTKGGFFFKDAEGSIRGAASYQEFVLEALPMRQVPAGTSTGSAPSPRSLRPEVPPHSPVLTLTPEPQPRPSASGTEKGRVPITREISLDPPFAEPEPAPVEEEVAEGEPEAPEFLQISQDRSWRAIQVVGTLAVLVALAGVGYQTRAHWLPSVMAKIGPVLPKDPPAHLALSATDENGQLKIRWDASASAVQNAVEGVLEISDGTVIPRSIRLDAAHLSTGLFSYGRETERVELALMVEQPNGQRVREIASFLGKLPGQKIRVDDPEVRKERDALAEKAAKLEKDLNFQASKTRRLERDLNDMRDQLDREQRRRLQTQSAEPTKKD